MKKIFIATVLASAIVAAPASADSTRYIKIGSIDGESSRNAVEDGEGLRDTPQDVNTIVTADPAPRSSVEDGKGLRDTPQDVNTTVDATSANRSANRSGSQDLIAQSGGAVERPVLLPAIQRQH